MKEKISVVTFEAQNRYSEELTNLLDTYFISSALNYQDDDKEVYIGYISGDFDASDLRKRAEIEHVVLPDFKLEIFEDKNWLIESAVRFDPIEVGDFCIYDAADKVLPQKKKILLQIYAQTAFGSTHPTTHLCLQALSDIANFGFKGKKILDVGTGSGILGIASAKKWQNIEPYVLGVDIDPTAVNVAGQNAFDNHVSDFFDVIVSDGLKSKTVQKQMPFDLVFANILARPLISMAQNIKKALKSGAYVVLSGFIFEQVDWVIGAYQKAGFKKIKLYQNGDWCAALMQKKEDIFEIQAKLKAGEAFLITRDNMFLGEDILPQENKILELSGFTGSAGMMLVGQKEAFLFVDGRYTLQARMEVKDGIEVIDSSNFIKDVIKVFKIKDLHQLVVNPWSLSCQTAEYFKSQKIDVKTDETAPMSGFLNTDVEVFTHLKKFAGQSAKEKCRAVAKALPEGADALLISSAQELSWLSNLRSHDLPYTPVLRAFGLLKRDGKLKIYSFNQIKKLINDIKKVRCVITNGAKTPFAFAGCANVKNVCFDVLAFLKLQKNAVELKGFVQSHISDGVALVKFLHWLETHYQGLSELEIVEKLHDFRQEGKYYFSESFATIAAVNKNAAIVHYEPSLKTNKKMGKNAILLLDSGAQYFNATTDVTRTVGLGRITDEVKTSFTEVLKAHIALADLVFDEKTPANVLDKVCRDVMLEKGKNYKHGTGHSVGHFSNVHEPPFSINEKNSTPVLAHYVTSIEPGYYLEGKYGIRIENLYYTEYTKDKKQLCFKPLTLCPIDFKMIKTDMLSETEKKWLNGYHEKVFETLSPYLNKAQKMWLAGKCQKI